MFHMPARTPQTYEDTRRARRTPPHVPLGTLRTALGLTLDQVCERVADENPTLGLTRGHLSGVENGHRGASAELLDALAVAYGIAPSAVSTDYAPRTTPERVA